MRTIVVADDLETMRKGVSSTFVKSGFMVVAVAKSGAEAVEACKRYQPDWVSLDFEMPGGMTGLDAARAIRRACPRTRIAFFSACGGDQFISRLVPHGNAYFPKQMMYVDSSLHKDIQTMFETLSQGKRPPMEDVTEPLFWSRTTLPGGFLVYKPGRCAQKQTAAARAA